MPFPKASRALERFTVLDLTRVRSGPTCVRQLADWGANVIKIELPPEPGGGEPLGGPREGSDFQNLHRNKRSMTLNLKAPEAVAAFKRMVKKADVVVENFRPDVKRRLGIDYPQLRKINPKLVYASISGFGQTGPYAARPGFDQIAQGMGGLMSITGLPGQGPVRVGIPIADLTAGLFCALGILVALLEREKSKQGQHVTTSLLQAQIFMLDFQGARWLIEGDVPKQAGNNHPTSIPTGVFKTADGHINIASTGSKIWARFCAAADASELLQRPEYQTAAERSKNRDALNADIERYTVKRTSAEWIERLNKAGVPCGPIYSIDQVYADPQVEHLGMAQAVKTKDKSKLRMAGQPMSLSRTPSRLVARAAQARRAYRRGAQGVRVQREGHRGAAQGERGLTDADELARMTTARGGRVMDDVTKTDKMLSRKDGRVGYVIFNNPERHNAVSLDMWAATSRILEDFAKDDEVRVVVLTGAGGKAFVSGADISKFESERATLDATKHYNATVETRLCRSAGISQADHRHDPRLLHRRRARARGLLRSADLLRQFAFRGARREAWAGLLLCRPAPARRCGRAGLRPGNLLHGAAVRHRGGARDGPGQSRRARGRARGLCEELRRDHRRQCAAHGEGGEIHRRRSHQG